MNSLISSIRSILKKTLKEIGVSDEIPVVTPATQEKFGHYQCNSAMKLAKALGCLPRDLAQKWCEKLEKYPDVFEKVEVAGPGFINLTLTKSYLSDRLNHMLETPRLGISQPESSKRVIVEFSSPNIAKEMHVGHLRSTIIGESIARLLEFVGHCVIRLNHVGDWGTSFGMLIAYMKQTVPEVLGRESQATLADLMEWYRASKKCFDEDSLFKERARLEVVALQRGDKEALSAWQLICDISRKAFNEVYCLLDVSLQERGESFYNPYLPALIEDLEAKGLIEVSEGAKCVFLEGFKIPLMVQKSDGGFNYDTTDLAAMKYRIEEDKADWIICVVDSGQGLHFDLVKGAAIKAGYLDPCKVRFDHVAFGLVLGEDGKKFRTRSGDVVKLSDLLNTAVEKASALLDEREHEASGQELEQLARVLGIDAVKYADLSCNRLSDYTFSFDRMLRFEGNTAAFILYSYVRSLSIQRKLKEENNKKEPIVLEHPSECALGLILSRFHETIETFEKELFPHVLTDYLYQLAQAFNVFFRDCRVGGSEHQARRLRLLDCVSQVMEKGLFLLGLEVVDQM